MLLVVCTQKKKKIVRRRNDTTEGDVGEAVLAGDIEGIGEEAIKGLGDHGEVGGVLKDLEGGWIQTEAVLQEEHYPHPWVAPHSLHKEP